MIAKLRAKSQITIPQKVVAELGLEKGDRFEVFSKDGIICLMPVAIYPQEYVSTLRREIEEMKGDISSGKQPVFSSTDRLFDELENKE